ncbi:hypothetical protein [Companilactobacillus mishanensis]|uniref:OsmC family protein n=1 Tax=Companilactobacillus mishanensis TaxID=2486008 RepID=A0ABW9P3Q5_9LACO|nr:hypothetical protein [Companilactobacillus mishanensis]MQS43903.1 hypothetical protein [Companilactobacillus mishanensis]
MEKRYLNSANNYDIEFRAISTDGKKVKIRTDKVSYSVDEEMSFDIANDVLTSVDHFTGGIASGMISAINRYDQKHDGIIDQIEGKFTFHLSNPLTYLDVRGYDETPHVSALDLQLYLVSFNEADELEQVYQEAMKNSIVYQTIKDTIKIEHKIKVVL